MKTFNVEIKHIQEVVSSFYVMADSEDSAITKLKEAFEQMPNNIFKDDTTEILNVTEEAQLSFMFEETPSKQVH